MEHMQLTVDDILSQILSTEVVILGDRASWLGSCTIDHTGWTVFDLLVYLTHRWAIESKGDGMSVSSEMVKWWPLI